MAQKLSKAQKAFDELDKVRKNTDNVYIILKDSEKVGIICNRWTYTCWNVAHVTVVMYGKTGNIAHTETLGGCGYDKFSTAMERFLTDYSEELKKHFNIDTKITKDLFNSWRKPFENAGYKLINLF